MITGSVPILIKSDLSHFTEPDSKCPTFCDSHSGHSPTFQILGRCIDSILQSNCFNEFEILILTSENVTIVISSFSPHRVLSRVIWEGWLRGWWCAVCGSRDGMGTHGHCRTSVEPEDGHSNRVSSADAGEVDRPAADRGRRGGIVLILITFRCATLILITPNLAWVSYEYSSCPITIITWDSSGVHKLTRELLYRQKYALCEWASFLSSPINVPELPSNNLLRVKDVEHYHRKDLSCGYFSCFFMIFALHSTVYKSCRHVLNSLRKKNLKSFKLYFEVCVLLAFKISLSFLQQGVFLVLWQHRHVKYL